VPRLAVIPREPWARRRGGLFRRALRSSSERSVYDTLRMAQLAVRPARQGLDERSAYQVARATSSLLDVAAVAVATREGILAYYGVGSRHHNSGDAALAAFATDAMELGRSRSAFRGELCSDDDCPLGESVAIPIKVGNDVVGALVVIRMMGRDITLGVLRAGREVARLLGVQLALAEVDETRQQLVNAQSAALRAQISPHFAYNTLTAAASLVRRDPERAREVLVEFAEFSRYILRNDKVNTTLSDELRNVHTYMDLERARHQDRLEVVFRVDPGVLPVVVPMLILQPLVENAVQHGIEPHTESGTVTIVAEDRDEEVFVAVTDTGSGMDQDMIESLFAGDGQDNGHRTHVGLRNVHERLQTTYGERYRLTVESNPGKGTSVSFCVPKFRAGL
jgi:two-component system, LytTR family, sensor kinase